MAKHAHEDTTGSSPDAKAPAPAPEPATGLSLIGIGWRAEVAEHDYAAAEAYLSIKLDADATHKAVKHLRKAKLTSRRANDILRAAGLSAAPLDDPGVIKDLIKVVGGTELSPVLVVNGAGGPDIADGYHRVSLVYRIDPYGNVPLKLADTD
jgi:hypothetical protein